MTDHAPIAFLDLKPDALFMEGDLARIASGLTGANNQARRPNRGAMTKPIAPAAMLAPKTPGRPSAGLAAMVLL